MKDLSSKKFNRWTVLSYQGRNEDNRPHWLCLCKCGTKKIVLAQSLKNGKSKSCGCWRSEVSKKSCTIHDLYGTRIHTTWRGMISRCYHKGQSSYKHYGARGIKVYSPWRKSLLSFYKYMGDPPSKVHSIDRINNDGNYEPGNVRWATRKQQANNQRRRSVKNKS